MNCPCCKAVLYTLSPEVTRGGNQKWRLTQDSPAVRKDAKGSYVSCGRCRNRIAVEPAEGQGQGFVLAAKQECGGRSSNG